MSVSFFKRNCFVIAFTICTFSIIAPLTVFCQDPQDEEEFNSTPSNEGSQDINQPVVGNSSPWGNAGADNGTREGATVNPQDPRSGTGNVRSTLGRPATTLGHEPPNNPDVPFDDNMNLGFLLTGVAFAFWIGRKQVLKTARVSNNR